MKGVFTAETAILVELETIGIVLLVLGSVVISLFAFCANECDFHSHSVHLPVNLSGLPPSKMELYVCLFLGITKKLSNRGRDSLTQIFCFVKGFLFFSFIYYVMSCRAFASSNMHLLLFYEKK